MKWTSHICSLKIPGIWALSIEFQCTGCERLNKGLQLSMAEFDRHLDKKMDERNLQTLNQGFGGLLLFFDCLIKIEKKYLRPVTTTKNSISKGLRTAKSRIQKWRLPIVLVSKYDKTHVCFHISACTVCCHAVHTTGSHTKTV